MKGLAKYLVLIAVCLYGHAAMAEDTDVIEIERDGVALATELDVRPDDRDFTDTAIVASAVGRGALVVCQAYNANGRFLGSAAMRVPANGLRYLRASDLANGVDYVGQVRCKSRHHSIAASAYLIAPGGITNLGVEQKSVHGVLHIQAPVTASF